jgi:hypothetical protein
MIHTVKFRTEQFGVKMENMELYKKIASEIKEKLGHNHVSTIIQLDLSKTEDKIEKKLPQFLIIVKNFDKFTIMMITNVLKEYSEDLAIPFVVEYKDLRGMLDSIPKSFLDIKMNYLVLAGEDITEMIKPPSYEHFRAQNELILRNDLTKLRRDLISVMSHKMSFQEYIKDLSIVALNSIRNYYKIIDPKLQTTEDLITRFIQDFPDGNESLQKILEFTYSTIKGKEITDEDKLQLILSTFDNVLQPLLIELNEIGIEFEKNLMKDSDRLSFEEFVDKYSDEISRLQDAMCREFEDTSVKQGRILRGELELKFRKREKTLIKKYEEEINNIKNRYESQLEAQQKAYDEEVEHRAETFIDEKLVAEREQMKQDYEDKIKKIRDELEFKYITTDLHDKEEKLRKEFNQYEKKLRDDFDKREKTLRAELEIKEKNYKDSMELDYKARLEDEKDKLRKDFNEELEETLNRKLRKQEKKFEAEKLKREKALERTLLKEFSRKERELLQKFKRDLQAKEKEVKNRLELEFERAKGKVESRRYDELMKIVDKEIGLRYKELEKIQFDLLKVMQNPVNNKYVNKETTNMKISRNFLSPPDEEETGEEKDLFSKILRDNRALHHGIRKKNIKKVS